jgi:hypothetical protein
VWTNLLDSFCRKQPRRNLIGAAHAAQFSRRRRFSCPRRTVSTIAIRASSAAA